MNYPNQEFFDKVIYCEEHLGGLIESYERDCSLDHILHTQRSLLRGHNQQFFTEYLA